jgi:hypothetical protein
MGRGGVDSPFLISAPDGGEWSASLLGRFTHEKRVPPPYPFGGRLCGPQNRSGRCGIEKNLLVLDVEHRLSNPVAVPKSVGIQTLNRC